MSDDLIERLDLSSTEDAPSSDDEWIDINIRRAILCKEAADTIGELREENRALKGLLKEGYECCDDLICKTDAYLGINEAIDRATRFQMVLRDMFGVDDEGNLK